jgi:hypothetical protein
MKLLEELTGAPFRFTARPIAIPPDLRPIWRMTILVLFLHRCCRHGKSSLKKLHVLNWAIRHPASRQTLLDVLGGRALPDRAIVRFDPALNRALDLAKGEKLVEQVSGDRFQITAKGQQLAEEAMSDPECLTSEKWFMSEVASQVTEVTINRLLGAVS